MPTLLRAVHADITTLAVAAIVRVSARSIAFPGISTGIYGYPVDRAARVAVSTVRVVLQAHALDEVIFCCFSAGDLAVYESILAETN